MHRHWEIDALRGLMLLLMLVTHLPTRLTTPLGQPFGFVSAAEGFVLLAAYMCGRIYGRTAVRDGTPAMQRAFWRRALKVYACQAATLAFLFTAIAWVGMKIDQQAVKNLMGFYLQAPVTALWAGLLLVYEPPLLDILPLYVLFMLASPWVMAWGLRHGWGRLLAASVALWAAAQFGLSGWLHRAAVAAFGLPVPYPETGAFSTFGWQLLWVAGLWLGVRHNEDGPLAAARAAGAAPRLPQWLVWLAAGIACVGFVWRHAEGQAPFGADESLNLLFDKWLLGPLRLLNLAALGIVTLQWGGALARRLPRQRWLESLGAASLPVFCAHLVLVLTTLAFLGDSQSRPWAIDAPLLAGCLAVLLLVAQISRLVDEHAARVAAARGPAAPPAATAAAAAENAAATAAPLARLE